MGKTKIKTIDYFEGAADESRSLSKAKGSYSEPADIGEKKPAKSERNKAVGAVEHTEEVNTSENLGAKQAHNEPTGRTSGALAPDKQKKKIGSKKIRSKKYQEKTKLVDPAQKYNLEEAVKLAQSASYSKFEGTLEAHINTAVKNIRGLVSLPHLSGKTLTVLAFGKGGKVAGADIEGTEETISEIEKGPSASSGLKFDVLVTTPEWMPKLAKVAKILGPRGLMPNPKNGTITENLSKTITDLKGGKIEYKTESNRQVIHLPIGKTTQASEEIIANVKVLYQTIGKSKIKKITLSPTMGPGVKVNLTSI